MADDDLQPAIPVADLPGAAYLLGRLGASDEKSGSLKPQLASIAVLALKVISQSTGIPFRPSVFLNECMPISGRTGYVIPRWWPVIKILKATAGASTVLLRVPNTQVGDPSGNLIDLAQGRADVAVGIEGRTIRFNQAIVPINAGFGSSLGRGPEFYITYLAGMSVLPEDLLETFWLLAETMYKEKDRIGEKNVRVGEGIMAYTRDLPPWAVKAVRSYRRTEVY